MPALHRLLSFFLLSAAGTACAHPGRTGHVQAGFLAGLLDAFTGADALATVLVLGVWVALGSTALLPLARARR